MNKTIVAIDPGAYGALVAIYKDGEVEYECMPMTLSKHRVVDAIRVGEFIDRVSHTDVIIVWENVHSFPGQGVASSFKFGLQTGLVVGAAISRASGNGVLVSQHKITPRQWKKHFDLIKTKKEAAVDKMKELLPHHDFSGLNKQAISGVADAYLIGRYFVETNDT